MSQQQYENEFSNIEQSSIHLRELNENTRTKIFTSALRPQACHKNRYPDILPFERTRVRLETISGQEGSDYINANHIFSDRQFISCQAPLFSTINDFWRMIWEEKCPGIVMLTRLMESGKIKATMYWPQSSSGSLRFGEIEVTLLEELQFEHFTCRHLLLQRETEVREVYHLHFTEWPDFGTPTSTEGIRQLIEASRAYAKNSGPLVVHCSAGIGRSGTFIAIHRALDLIEQEAEYDVKTIVSEMRQHRWGMVQTEKQYSFIYRAIEDHIAELDRTSTTDQFFSSSEDEMMNDSVFTFDGWANSPDLHFSRRHTNNNNSWRNTSNDCVNTLQTYQLSSEAMSFS